MTDRARTVAFFAGMGATVLAVNLFFILTFGWKFYALAGGR